MIVESLSEAVLNDEVTDVEGVEAHLKDYVPEEILGVAEEGDVEDVCLRLGNKLNLEVRAEEVARIYEDGEELGEGECELCEREMPLTAHHLMPRETHRKYRKKGLSQEFLNTCTMICRPCHSHIHKTYDNERLAAELSTVEKLLDDDAILRFVKWAAKQRTTSTEMAANNRAKYRR
uniref:HNH domain-containing protein n=1 Tax=Phaeomonas parva TaxID=124430 RepID=A0A7S1U0G4_9STRA|mmetsp:Transcript_2332/g.6963  ORF Transcript_2332/g.6963 Transcript_2332/m.6963 type:complete len:177 (+) Transcript_2332:84-614(+)